MKLLPAVACLLVCATTLSQAETVDILGLPLGKTFKAPLAPCATSDSGTDAKNLCWASPPDILDDGTRSGIVNVPDGKQPRWAAQGKYVASLARDGKLTAFSVHTENAADFDDIARYFAGQFGAPRHPTPRGAPTASVYWNAKYAQIELTCPAGKGCDTRIVFTDWNDITQRGLERYRSTEMLLDRMPTPARR
jgi:hypothetical protein